MNSCLFGSRDVYERSSYYYGLKPQQNTFQNNPYPCTNPHTAHTNSNYFSFTPYGKGYYQYPTSQHHYPQYPTPQRRQLQSSYPYGNSNLSYGLSTLPSYPSLVTVPSQPLTLPYHNNYSSWEKPVVIIPSRGLETLLIAILILVALDMLFVRSRR